jgi:translation initiation factor IF-1
MTEQKILMNGKITVVANYTTYKVMLDNGVEILANTGKKAKQKRLALFAGDKVRVELSTYDLTRGIIVDIVR